MKNEIKQKELENMNLLLEFLLDPTEEKDHAFCVSCDQLLKAKKGDKPIDEMDVMDQMEQVIFKKNLKEGSPAHWDKLERSINSLENQEIKELFKKAKKFTLERVLV